MKLIILYETLWIVGSFVKFECQAPMHKRKALLLTTFWRRFCLAVNLARTILPAVNLASSCWEVHIRANCYLCLDNTHCLSVFPLPLFSHNWHLPSSQTWSVWVFTVAINRVTGVDGVVWTTTVGYCRQNAGKS